MDEFSSFEPSRQQYTKERYPLALKDRFKGIRVAVLGAGHAYRERAEPALRFLGAQDIAIYDPNTKKIHADEAKIDSVNNVSSRQIAYILSPNNFHATQALDFLARGIRFYVEKPIAISSQEIAKMDQAVSQAIEPSYYGDYYLFKAIGLLSLMGIEIPFKEYLKIEQDSDNFLRQKIDAGTPLVGRIVRIEGSLLEGGETSTATIQGREWLGDLRQGGGMLFDLMVHLLNISNLLNLSIDSIDRVVLATRTDERGKYIPLPIHNWETAEDFAEVYGTTKDDIPVKLIVGKYAKEHNRYVLLEDETGAQLKLSFTSDNYVEWIDPNGVVRGRVTLLADPYMLTMADAAEHLTKGNGPKFYQTQRDSVIIIDKMHKIGREGKI